MANIASRVTTLTGLNASTDLATLYTLNGGDGKYYLNVTNPELHTAVIALTDAAAIAGAAAGAVQSTERQRRIRNHHVNQ